MYSCYELSSSSRLALLKAYPHKYPEVYCNHITVQFGVRAGSPLPMEPTSIEVVGYADDGRGLEALLVAVDGNTKREDGENYHITLSLDLVLGYKPKDSIKLVSQPDKVKSVKPIKITATPKIL